MNTYDVGDEIKITAVFRDMDNALSDPDSVVCRVLKPGGVYENVTTVRDSLGNYHASIIPATGEHGTWWYRFSGVGTVNVSEESQFKVKPRKVV